MSTVKILPDEFCFGFAKDFFEGFEGGFFYSFYRFELGEEERDAFLTNARYFLKLGLDGGIFPADSVVPHSKAVRLVPYLLEDFQRLGFFV